MKTQRHVVISVLLSLLVAIGCSVPRTGGAASVPISVVVAGPSRFVEVPTEELLDAQETPELVTVDQEEDLSPQATVPLAPAPEPEPEPVGARFFDQLDAPILEALANQRIARIERGGGGRSIGFKIYLADGTRGYFKPEQNAGSTRWYAELAAYHLDRELALGRTAPSVGRIIPMARLRRAAAGDARLAEIVVRNGQVRGALIWWIPERLRPAPLETGWEHWLRVDGELPALDPFVTPPEFRRSRARAVRLARRGRALPARVAPFASTVPDTSDRAAELSDLVVFDYLTANQDRWGGHYTNVRTRGQGGAIVYLDNGAAFRPGRAQRDRLLDSRIGAVERFRASTLEAVRALDIERLVERMSADPFGPYLSQRQLDGLSARRAYLLACATRAQTAHGEAATPW